MNYEVWPGIGLSDEPVEWEKVLGSAVLSAKSTANVDRRRKTEGKDFSTFKGISHKSDETNARGAPKTMRRRTPGVMLGPAPGHFLKPESTMGRLRAALETGPMTRAELREATGVDPKNITGYLKNDIAQGRIVVIKKDGCFQQFALAEVA